VKILDFGLAKLTRISRGPAAVVPTTGNQTEPGVVMGTVGYMSPEQVRAQAADYRTDIFAFGAILYEMLSGKPAFRKPTSADTMSAILNEEPTNISRIVPATPRALQRVVHRCLEKNPEQRFQSAWDLAFALEALSDSSSTPALSSARPEARRKWTALTAVGLALCFLVWFGLMQAKQWRQLGSARNLSQIRSIAVLPLQNLSADPTQEYFSDGMTDALITDLAQIASVRVISRTSSMEYKQTKKSLPEIARELDVDGIIEGTVQRSGNRVRITAQLIHGRLDKHIWANSYERDLRDVFVLERDVTQDIVREIEARLTTHNRMLPAQPQAAVNLKALEAYLQGNYRLNEAWRKPYDKELRTAGEYFQHAIDAQPDFALAYVGLAEAHHLLLWPSSEDFALMKQAAEKAVALDPASSEARTELALMKVEDWDWSGAEEEYRRAVTLNPNNADAHGGLAGCISDMGRLEEGWKEEEIAQALDPGHDHLSVGLYRRGQYDRSIELLQKSLETRPRTHQFTIFFHKIIYKRGCTRNGLGR
jgi:TolB-like protein